MQIQDQNDKFYITDQGKRIAKNGLSQTKRDEFDNMLGSKIVGAPETNFDMVPMNQTIAAPQGGSVWEQPAQTKITSAGQLGAQMPQQQASTGAMDMTPYNEPQIDPGAMKAYETGINIQQGALRKQAEIARKQAIETEKVMVDNDRAQTMIDYDLMMKQEKQAEAVNTATQNLAITEKTYADFKVNPDRFFEGQTGKQLLAGIAIAFGSIGAAMTGSKENTALSIINKAIDNDIKAQESSRDQLKEAVTQKQKAIDVIKANFKDERDFQLAQKATAIGMAEREIQRIATRYGTPEADAKAQSMIGQLEVQRGQLLDEMNQRAIKRAEAEWAAQNKTVKKTATQQMAATFAERLQEAEKNFAALEEEGFNRASKATAFWEAVKPESFESEQYKMQSQAERNFVNSVLRRESGAAISEDEFANAEMQYFPRAGDTKKVIEQKKRNREIVMKGLFREAEGVAQEDTSEQDAMAQRGKYDINRTQTGGR